MSREDGVRAEQAWLDFCEELKGAGRVLLREELELDALDRAEGLRYLSRLTRAGLFAFAEKTGPRHPVFAPLPDLVKMGLDNPDNHYLSASIQGGLDYRIRGRRGSIHYLSFAAQSQNFAVRDKITGGAGHLHDAQLEIDADGCFEILASAKEQPGNWLRLARDSSQILCRQTFLDRAREVPVALEIECLQRDGAPGPLELDRVQGHLLGAARYASGIAQWFADWVLEMGNHADWNAFHRPPPEQHRLVGGDPEIQTHLGRWKLAPGEALVIDLEPPECDYWNFQLGNIWAESLDHRFARVHLNSASAQAAPDGRVRIVVAETDPGQPNWVETVGHRQGTMAVRWVRTRLHPRPITRVVRLDSIE